MTNQLNNYLHWRCRMNWHTKYLKYIDEWISNVTDNQLIYFEKEMNHLIDRGIYETIH